MSDMELFEEEEKPLAQDFKVDSLEKADWAMRKIGRAEAEIDRFTELAKDMKARIDARLAQITGPHIHTIDTMTEFLKPWANVEVAKAHGKKSVNLLSGTVGFRTQQKSLEVADEEKAAEWLEKNGHADCVKVAKTVKKVETKKMIEASGELPDECKLSGGGQTFYAEPLRPALESK